MDPLEQRLKFQDFAPFAVSIGLRRLHTEAGAVTLGMAPARQTRLSEVDARLHPWALIGMADHAISYALATLSPPTAGLSTLDLRLDFGPVPTGEVTAQARVLRAPTQNGTGTLVAHDTTGTPVIAAVALFNCRGFPGGGNGIGRRDVSRFELDHDGPFLNLIGFRHDSEKVWLEGGARRTVGFEGLPALHGGVIGALLAEACARAAADHALAAEMRLATLHIRFLRPGELQPLYARAHHVRAGRSAAFFTAECFHVEEKLVAEAQVTFAPGDG